MIFAARSHQGYARSNNEDACYIPGKSGAPDRLIAVADGMGGHSSGEVASALALQSIVRQFADPGYVSSAVNESDAVFRAIDRANSAVYEAMQRNPELKGMGTTVTCALLEDEKIVIGHVGDSRAYLLHNGVLTHLTQDHTLVQQLIDLGELTPEEAEVYPGRNVITRALGTEKFTDIDTNTILWEKGDRLVLCTDGLTLHVSDARIQDVLGRLSPENAVNALVDLALAGGGKDNITVVIAQNGGDEHV